MAAESVEYNFTDHRKPTKSDAGDASRASERQNLPTRSSTVGSADEIERNKHQHSNDYYAAHARSEDLNHTMDNSLSAPSLSTNSRTENSSMTSTTSKRRNSASSANSALSDSSYTAGTGPPTSTTHTSASQSGT